MLSHGEEYLRGDSELPVFVAGARGLPQWYEVPDEEAQAYGSKATVAQTEAGTLVLSGVRAGGGAARQMLAGEARAGGGELARLGRDVVGMGSTALWEWDLSQHHWLEMTMRTDGRKYDFVLRCDGRLEGSHWFWRAPLPAGPPVRRRRGADGPYKILGLERDASAEEVRGAYVALAKQAHPDRAGGSEERFKVLSKAYALLADAATREAYDTLGAGFEGEAGAGELGEWRTFKLPFSAFLDRRIYDFAEHISHMYIVAAEGEEGPFRLELGGVVAGRCSKGGLPSAGFFGAPSCELGHCACGYYNGWRVEAFSGPLSPDELPPSPERLKWGYAHHHYDQTNVRW